MTAANRSNRALSILVLLAFTQSSFSPAGLAQDGNSSTADPSRNLVGSTETRSADVFQGARSKDTTVFVFEGSVYGVDGTPAREALVVSAAGGEAVTDLEGKFRLEVAVPREAKSLHLTAVDRYDGNTLASKQVQLSGTSGSVQGVTLHLAQGTSCVPSWLPAFGGQPGVGGEVLALAVFDDGAGPALYVGGTFKVAGGTPASRIARWDGQSWEPLGAGISGDIVMGSSILPALVGSLTVFNDGTGERLIAGGRFSMAGGVAANNIAMWDGSTWTALGAGVTGLTPFARNGVKALAEFDDGTGVALYAGGDFTIAGGAPANNIAKWDGSSWTTLGSGMDGSVNALIEFDDGGGVALFGGGFFATAGGLPARGIAKWDGSAWTAVGGSTNGAVNTLVEYDDGTGVALYAGGQFSIAGVTPANNVASWDGSSWTALGSGTAGGGFSSPTVNTLAVHSEGGVAALFAGGWFLEAGGLPANKIAKWDGSSWSAVGVGIEVTAGRRVSALASFDDGGGAILYGGGNFLTAGSIDARNIARWDSSSWTALDTGFNAKVIALAAFDDGSGEQLFVGGDFSSVDGVATRMIGKWDGSGWSPLGSGMNNNVEALVVFDDGNGDRLIAGGRFALAGGVPAAGVAEWDGSSWASLGGGVDRPVYALASFDDGGGPALYAGGFIGILGEVLGKWDGMSWSGVGGTLAATLNGGVFTLTVFDDGSGPALFVGGSFTGLGGVPASNIAKWDGSTWTALGTGVDGFVQDMAVFDDGNGARLVVGGRFTTAGGVTANRIATWDGSSWAALGTGFNDYALEVRAFDDGNGTKLFAGGRFTTAGGAPASGIAQWDGSSWAPVGSGVQGFVSALTVFDDGNGDALFAGGGFGSAIDSGDSFLAKWGCQFGLTNNFCNGDGGDQLGCTDCPCGNNAAPGTIGGCLNSALTSSRLVASGDPAVNLMPGDTGDLRFALTSGRPNSFCVLTSGDALAPRNPGNPCFGFDSGLQALAYDGLRCAVFNTRRHGGRAADANGDVGITTNPWGGEGGPNVGIAASGMGFAAGQTRFFQVVHRENPLLGCMRGLNTSQAVSVLFTPGS